MKKTRFYISLSALALLFLVPTCEAQTYELSGLYGYQLGTKLNYSGGNLRVDDGELVSTYFGINVRPGVTVELGYQFQKDKLYIKDFFISPFESRLADLKTEWFTIGVMRYANNGQARPFGGISFGMAAFSASNSNMDIVSRELGNRERFSLTVTGGLKYMFTTNVGLRIQGQLLVPVEWGGIYISGGSGGASTGASVGSTTIEGAFSGGLIFAFGDDD